MKFHTEQENNEYMALILLSLFLFIFIIVMLVNVTMLLTGNYKHISFFLK